MPIRLLTLLVTLLHVYIGLRLLPALATLTGAWPLLLAALLLSAATMPLPFIGVRGGGRRRALARGWKWLGLLSMGSPYQQKYHSNIGRANFYFICCHTMFI